MQPAVSPQPPSRGNPVSQERERGVLVSFKEVHKRNPTLSRVRVSLAMLESMEVLRGHRSPSTWGCSACGWPGCGGCGCSARGAAHLRTGDSKAAFRTSPKPPDPYKTSGPLSLLSLNPENTTEFLSMQCPEILRPRPQTPTQTLNPKP